MTFTHEDANARLLDLVYGEAAPDVRAALEAHIATCSRCTADLAALGDTRALLRTSLDEADAPVPARAHAAILAAAAAALAPAAPPARAAVAAGPSLWERLRGRWTLPTFATVGAIAVVVIASKVFLEPERTAERGREVVGAAPPPVATTAPERMAPSAPEGAPAADKAPAEPAPHRLDPNALGGVAQDAIDRSRLHGAGAHAGLLGVTSSAARLARARQDAPGASDGFGALGGLQGIGSGGGASAARGAGAAAPSASRPAVRKRSASADEDLAQDDLRAPSEIRAEKAEAPAPRGGFAPPPSGWKGGASASAPAAAPPPASPAPPRPAPATAGARAADVAREEESAAAPQVLAKKKSVYAAEAAESDAPVSNAAPAKSAQPAPKDAEKERKQDEGGVPSQETLARRADQLFATRRWSEAILAYRELLRRYPSADLTPRWRARITQAEVASESDAAKTASRAKAAAKPTPKAGKETGRAPADLEPTPAQ